MKYTVHTVPLLYRPFYFALSWLIGLLLYGWLVFNRVTCRVRHHKHGNMQADQNYIYTFWHDDLSPYFMCHLRYRQPYIWLNHPLWFMKPIHVMLYLMGTEIALGSSGNSGKAALQKVIAGLQAGKNTVITPDGPAGPEKVLKKGVLQMSLHSGVPIVPMRFVLSRAYRYPFGWDHKRMPYPFSSIDIVYGQPVVVTEDNYEPVRVELGAWMNGGNENREKKNRDKKKISLI